jgi:hypothetical protein
MFIYHRMLFKRGSTISAAEGSIPSRSPTGLVGILTSLVSNNRRQVDADELNGVP